MFCVHCGKEIEDGVKFCPYCENPVGGEVKKKAFSGALQEAREKMVKGEPIFSGVGIASVVLAIISSLFVFIMTTYNLAKFGVSGINTVYGLVLFVSLASNIAVFFSKTCSKIEKMIVLCSIIFSGFVILYSFIGIMV